MPELTFERLRNAVAGAHITHPRHVEGQLLVHRIHRTLPAPPTEIRRVGSFARIPLPTAPPRTNASPNPR